MTTLVIMDIENRLKGIEDEIKRIKRNNLLISPAEVEELLGFLPPYSGGCENPVRARGTKNSHHSRVKWIPS